MPVIVRRVLGHVPWRRVVVEIVPARVPAEVEAHAPTGVLELPCATGRYRAGRKVEVPPCKVVFKGLHRSVHALLRPRQAAGPAAAPRGGMWMGPNRDERNGGRGTPETERKPARPLATSVPAPLR